MNRKRVFAILLATFILIYTGYVFADSLSSGNRANGDRPGELFKDFNYHVKEDIITVRLSENPDTGYVWHYSIENAGAVIYVEDGYIEDPETLYGSNPVREFKFQIKKGVDNTFRFKCYRRFEPEEIYKEHIIVISNSQYGSNIAVR